MTVDDIPSGTMVFVDANCFVYAATSEPQFGPACQRLLESIENKLIQGCTSASVLGDLAHRLMTIEAALMFGRSMTGIAYWLRRHPSEVQLLVQYQQSLVDLLSLPLAILPVTGTDVVRAVDLSRVHGLLTNDALIVAIMQDHGLTQLASNDADFDRVPGITRFAPI